MAGSEVIVQIKLSALLARQAALAQAADQGLRPRVELSVTAICQEMGISRQTFYTARERFEAEGVLGLLPRSRRPHHSPGRTAPDVEDAIVRARKQLADEGWDNGAVSIAYRLSRTGTVPPSIATINRILNRRGLVTPQPQKRPRSSWQRFTYSERNGCWQMDAFYWSLIDGPLVAVFEVSDDCTRLELGALAAPAETSEAAVACFLTAVDEYGPPAKLLTDNGLAFTGRRLGWRSALETTALALGVQVINSSPYHPQTCGKNERGHQTCQKWLRHQPAADTLIDLQVQLDEYRQLYNTTRPHQALGGRTPTEAAQQVTTAVPGSVEAHQPYQRVTSGTVSDSGNLCLGRRYTINVGRAHTGKKATIVCDGNHVRVFHGRTLLRELTLDPTRHYQPSGNGHPRQPTPTLSTMS
jgi:transposase InsO family protein